MPENHMPTRPGQNLLYWIGVAAAAVCMLLIFTGNTEIAWRLEHANLPASWTAGLIAIVAFLGAEYYGSRPGNRAAAELYPETLQQELQ